MMRLWVTLTVLPLIALTRATAQERPLPYPVTPPLEWSQAVQAGTRTTSGAPGAGYWQQWTNYTIHTRLDPASKRLTGTARIVYHNRSPDRLPTVFVHLLQNLHDSGAVRNESQEVTGGVEIQRVRVGRQLMPERPAQGPGYFVDGTVLGVRLPSPLTSRDSVSLEIEWSFTVPQSGAGRMGWSRDNLFFVAYWYPQMAVYDDVVGWQLDPYLGNAEFYAGFGGYDVTIEAPPGWVVRATGELTNASQVFPDGVVQRLARAMQTDSVVHVLTDRDFGAGRATRTDDDGWLAWRFSADTVRDFAFSATTESVWDATRSPVGDRDGDGETDYTRIEALYRAEAPRWQRAWRYGQHSIAFLSRWTGFPYPWPHMTAVEGAGIIGGGMEFPMMTLIGDYNQAGDSALYYVTAHELAHMWVPMIVSNDEKRRAWMDEGTTSFNENQARKEFFPGIDHDAPDRQSYIETARLGREGEIMRWSDYHYPGPAYVTASYRKPATLLATLRALIGDQAFREGLQTFIYDWAYKHPTPWDLFHAFNAAAGQDLGWFWRSWYYETWVLDQAVASVTTGTGETAGRQTTITVEDRGEVPMPTRLTITLANGRSLEREVPVSTWLEGRRSATVTVSTTSPVVKVEIDAAGAFPDVDRGNNVWDVRRER